MTKKITIVDYKCGNIFSLKNILKKLDYDTDITDDPEKIIKASKVILPGVGSFPTGINNLKKKNIDQALKIFLSKGNYLLGICLGMQLLLSKSYEFEENNGLGIIDGEVTKLKNDDNIQIKVPHVGWSKVKVSSENHSKNKILNDIKNQSYFYYIHSFKAETKNPAETIAFTSYGVNNFSSIIEKDNVVGCQFHPEKSGIKGESLIKNFLKL